MVLLAGFMRGSISFLQRCLREERGRTKLGYLSGVALNQGLMGNHSTRGHVNQAWGIAQRFFKEHPQHRATVRATSPVEPYVPAGQVLTHLQAVVQAGTGTYGPKGAFSWDTARNTLTPNFGGTATGGGGADYELKIVLRLAAEFLA